VWGRGEKDFGIAKKTKTNLPTNTSITHPPNVVV